MQFRDNPVFLQIYCSILNGLAAQFEVYGPPAYDEAEGFGASPQKWPEDAFVRRDDPEQYRIDWLVDRALMAAESAYLALMKEDEEIEQFNAKVNINGN